MLSDTRHPGYLIVWNSIASVVCKGVIKWGSEEGYKRKISSEKGVPHGHFTVSAKYLVSCQDLLSPEHTWHILIQLISLFSLFSRDHC